MKAPEGGWELPFQPDLSDAAYLRLVIAVIGQVAVRQPDAPIEVQLSMAHRVAQSFYMLCEAVESHFINGVHAS